MEMAVLVSREEASARGGGVCSLPHNVSSAFPGTPYWGMLVCVFLPPPLPSKATPTKRTFW